MISGGQWTSTFSRMDGRKFDDENVRELVDLIIGRNLFPCKMWNERIAFNVLMDRFQKREYEMLRATTNVDSKGVFYEPLAAARLETLATPMGSHSMGSPRSDLRGVLAVSMTAEENEEVQNQLQSVDESLNYQMFELLDINKDGYVDASELKLLMKGFGLSGGDEDAVIAETLRGIELQAARMCIKNEKKFLANLNKEKEKVAWLIQDFEDQGRVVDQALRDQMASWDPKISNQVIRLSELQGQMDHQAGEIDSRISREEFITVLSKKDGQNLENNRKDLEHVFGLFDRDDNGHVGLPELKRVRDELNVDPNRQINLDDAGLERMLEQLDLDGDGQLGMEEFVSALLDHVNDSPGRTSSQSLMPEVASRHDVEFDNEPNPAHVRISAPRMGNAVPSPTDGEAIGVSPPC